MNTNLENELPETSTNSWEETPPKSSSNAEPTTDTMSILLLQLTSMIVVFLITLAGALLPLKLIGSKASLSIDRRQRSEKILSYCNCLAGGVFLATCFLGLIPAAREKFRVVFVERKLVVHYPLCEAVVILGFFLILSFEQLAFSMQQHWSGRAKDDTIQMKPVHLEDRKIKVDDEDDDEDDELFSRGETDTQPMLTSANDDRPARNGSHYRMNSHRPEGARDDNDSRCGSQGDAQGHSHLGNVDDNTGLLRSLILLFALSTHSIFEGMALGLQEDIKRIVYLFIAMLAHESLAAFALGASLIKSSVRTSLFIIYGVLFSGMIPIGIALGLWINTSRGFAADICSAFMQAIAAGIFIFVTFFEILNHELEVQKDRPQKIALAVLGYVVLALLEAVG